MTRGQTNPGVRDVFPLNRIVDSDLERLYDEQAQRLFAFALNLTRSEDETREVLQELFVRLARDPDWHRGVRNERAFLLRLVHNLIIDRYRRREARDQRHAAFSEDSIPLFAPVHDPDNAALQTALETALGRLPPEQRAVVHLKLWEGLTFEEIGELLELSPNTAASRYRYGLDKLRQLLRPLYEEIK